MGRDTIGMMRFRIDRASYYVHVEKTCVDAWFCPGTYLNHSRDRMLACASFGGDKEGEEATGLEWKIKKKIPLGRIDDLFEDWYHCTLCDQN